MSTQEVSTNNRGGEDVPQPNELMVDEEGSQNISEAVEEPPAKRSKIGKSYQIPKTVVLEVLDELREADERMLSAITDYARERREMMKYINYIETLLHVSCTPHSKANQSWIN